MSDKTLVTDMLKLEFNLRLDGCNDAADAVERAAKAIGQLEATIAKLPAFADTGEHFVPGVDECCIVYMHYTNRGETSGYKVLSASGITIYWDSRNQSWTTGYHSTWTGHFYSTREAAQAEADRLNEENNDA